MPIITLITDWKSSDYYIGAIKGKILSRCPDANIVDVNHQIDSYNIKMAAFVLKHSYSNFPKGSIHIISVNSEPIKDKVIVAVKYDNHFFISTDNGIFSLLIEDKYADIVEIQHPENIGSFPELSVFADMASYIAIKQDITELGVVRKNMLSLVPMRPTIEDFIIIGQIIYIDSYGNAITNITYELFESVRKDREFIIFIKSNANKINVINTAYNQSEVGELLAIFNSINQLEIATRNGNVSQLLNLDTKSNIRIEFKEIEEVEEGKLF